MTTPGFSTSVPPPATNGDVHTNAIASPFLWTESLTLRYDNKTALVDVSLPVVRGAITALIGPSGCGKTSFLYCAQSPDRPDRQMHRHGACPHRGTRRLRTQRRTC